MQWLWLYRDVDDSLRHSIMEQVESNPILITKECWEQISACMFTQVLFNRRKENRKMDVGKSIMKHAFEISAPSPRAEFHATAEFFYSRLCLLHFSSSMLLTTVFVCRGTRAREKISCSFHAAAKASAEQIEGEAGQGIYYLRTRVSSPLADFPLPN